MDICLYYNLINPPFASHSCVEVLAERPAARYLPRNHEPIKSHNEAEIQQQVAAAEQYVLSGDEAVVQQLVQQGTIQDVVLWRLDQLEHRLLQHCEPTVL